ncbi:MAG: preprotein translocase subunit SecE [Patescibacteria group bacterium]|nr:preprotein translocase subunit SecE [Patescibacteria group bacterium]MDE1988638.1 preprotein translocase subunit SecE [Patescibacteria group bacterium]MDE2218096.1 preprotein translocase subunit SecE [Patescibacteria group bacterium]
MKIADYIKETKVELKHVNWPTRKQAIAFTVIVIAVSIGVSLFLGFFDFLFSLALKRII